MASLKDQSGVTVFEGTIEGLPTSGIPQGGPLTADLLTGGFTVRGESFDTTHGPVGASVQASDGQAGFGGTLSLLAGQAEDNASGVGGTVQLTAGSGGVNAAVGGAQIALTGAGPTNLDFGKAVIGTNNSFGLVGQALVADGNGFVVYGGVQIAAGVPVGAPTGLPFAVDTTAVTGGLYVWNGATWVKVSALP